MRTKSKCISCVTSLIVLVTLAGCVSDDVTASLSDESENSVKVIDEATAGLSAESKDPVKAVDEATAVLTDKIKDHANVANKIKSASFEEGKHYLKVANTKPDSSSDTVSVVEFFSYGCIHCFRLEQNLAGWKATKPNYVEFKRMPAHWNSYFEMLAQTFYTAELMKVTEKIHTPLFNAIHIQRRPIKNMAAMKVFFQDQGVDVTEFDKVFNSFAVKQKIKLSENAFENFNLSSVPSVVVGGIYTTDVTKAGSQVELMKVIDFLANKVKSER